MDSTISSTDSVTIRALLATNDRSLPQALSALLASNGIELQTVDKCGPEHFESQDYIILMLDGDLTYPVGDGLPALVVIAPSNPIEAYDKGADIVIDKPLRANVLMAKLRAVLRRYGVII